MLFLTLFLSLPLRAQVNPADIVNEMDEDLNIGGDIFSDFNEDVESAQVLEDERFYRYSRFFSFNIGVGMTSFTGNRGAAYDNEPPTYHISVVYFANFLSAFTLGIEYSRHSMAVDEKTIAYKDDTPGLVETNATRPFFGYRQYLDTSDLGTAITYSNPYLTGRMEYWYVTNKFVENKATEAENQFKQSGGFGFSVGAGLEFPIEMKSTYVNVEYLFHSVAFKDKYTAIYQPVYQDLTGYVHSVMVNYCLSW
ncbi:MAG: hypothetical protein ACOYL6_14275 [Bacteriovoracaceae bacterium]